MAAIMPGFRSLHVTRSGRLLEPHRVFSSTAGGPGSTSPGCRPGHDGDDARLMNAVPKRVATRTGIDATAWPDSTAIDGDPVVWSRTNVRGAMSS
jgi:hypothetical protein